MPIRFDKLVEEFSGRNFWGDLDHDPFVQILNLGVVSGFIFIDARERESMLEQYENEIKVWEKELAKLEKMKKTPGIGDAKIVAKKKIAVYKDIVNEMKLILAI